MSPQKPYFADPWFQVCAFEAIRTPELVREFDRLYGCNLSGRGTNLLGLMIDESTGKLRSDFATFCQFVHDAIYTRVERPAVFCLPKDT